MQLHYTPRSHFARKVRIVLGALAIPCELVDAGNAAGSDPAQFGPNPLLKVPTLVDGTQVVFESDHIAAWLVRRHDPADRFNVLTTDVDALNARAAMNGIMAAEAELLLAERTGLDTRAHRRFDKMREAIRLGLEWLEARPTAVTAVPTYHDFHLVSLWDHFALYDVVPLDYPHLRAHAARIDELPYVAATRPV
ncbi:MAG: glutathione S-transferase family protein [Proteobacteria bacterium]|nr:glutathione S-transferase family protein [Pseudomonadota bacterium]